MTKSTTGTYTRVPKSLLNHCTVIRITKKCPELLGGLLILWCGPHTNRLGLFRLSPALLSAQCGLTEAKCRKLFQLLEEGGIIEWDEDLDIVWIREYLSAEFEGRIKWRDHRVKSIRTYMAKFELPGHSRLFSLFMERYATDLGCTADDPPTGPFSGHLQALPQALAPNTNTNTDTNTPEETPQTPLRGAQQALGWVERAEGLESEPEEVEEEPQQEPEKPEPKVLTGVVSIPRSLAERKTKLWPTYVEHHGVYLSGLREQYRGRKPSQGGFKLWVAGLKRRDGDLDALRDQIEGWSYHKRDFEERWTTFNTLEHVLREKNAEQQIEFTRHPELRPDAQAPATKLGRNGSTLGAVNTGKYTIEQVNEINGTNFSEEDFGVPFDVATDVDGKELVQ